MCHEGNTALAVNRHQFDYRVSSDEVEFDARVYRQAYANHQSLVAAYFADRTSNLLNIADIRMLEENGFGLLGDFLQCPVPNKPFPRVNDHSHAPRDAFMQAIGDGSLVSQTGIEVEL